MMRIVSGASAFTGFESNRKDKVVMASRKGRRPNALAPRSDEFKTVQERDEEGEIG